MADRIKKNKKKIIGFVFTLAIIIAMGITIYWFGWGRWESFEFQTDLESILHTGLSEHDDERTFIVIDNSIEKGGVTDSTFIAPHYVMRVVYDNRKRGVDDSGWTQTYIDWRQAEVMIYNMFTMELVQTIDVLALMEESGANERGYQLVHATPRGVYIEGEDLHFEWELETDPREYRIRSGPGSHSHRRALRFKVDAGYTLLTDRTRSNPRRDRLDERDVNFLVEMSILSWHEREDTTSFREVNHLTYIEGFGGIRFSYDRFPGVVSIDMPASRLPMENHGLYSCFPELLELRGREDLWIQMMIGGFPSAEEITLMLIEDGEEISFEGLVLPKWLSIDSEEHEIHGFTDYNRLRCREEWEIERHVDAFSLEMELEGHRFSLPTHFNNLRDIGLDLNAFTFCLYARLEPGEEVFVVPMERADRRKLRFLSVNLGSELQNARDSGVFGFSVEGDSRWFGHVRLNGGIHASGGDAGDAQRALWILPIPSVSFFGIEATERSSLIIRDRHIFVLGGHTLLELVTEPEINRVVAFHVRNNYDGRDWNEFLELLEGGVSQDILESIGIGPLYRDGGYGYIQSGETPQRILNYTAPQSLDDESNGIIYSFYGDYYIFPTPLQAFVDNGWEIESELDTIREQSGQVNLRRGEEEITLDVANLEENLVPLEYYHIVRIVRTWHQSDKESVISGFDQVLHLTNLSLRRSILSEHISSEYNADSVNIRLFMGQTTGEYSPEKTLYEFEVGESIIRIQYFYRDSHRFLDNTLYLRVAEVELIH